MSNLSELTVAAFLPERAVAYYCRRLPPLPRTKMDQNAEGLDASIPKKIVIKNVKYAASRPSWWWKRQGGTAAA